MSRLDALPDSARLWLFVLDGAVPQALVGDVRAFCASWTSHGRPVRASAEALGERVVAVAAQITEQDVNAGISGCGIDAMQHAVEAATERLGVGLVPALSVTYRDAQNAWQTAVRPAFRRLVRSGDAHTETRVLDVTPATLGALRAAGGVERAAGAAWHATAFQMRASEPSTSAPRASAGAA